MTQKRITLLLGLILLLIFGGLLLAQYKIFYGTKPTFLEMIEEVMVEAKKENWEKADETLKKVEEKWQKAEPLITIKYADTQYSLLNIAFEGLRASIDDHNSSAATKEGKICMMLFKNITSISSKP